MLTKEQILRRMNGFECPMYLLDSNWKQIYDQCVAAIDLATENERLKAKLDAVRAECEQSLQSSRGLSAKLSVLRLLEIIDKDGE